MSCYHPMVLVKTSDMTDPNQRKIAERLKLLHKGEGKSTSTFLIPRELAVDEGLTLEGNNAILVPCGHCIGCRLDYSRQWAERCVHEAEKYEFNYFLTLTYDDEHLPRGSKGVPSLVKDELSDFMKALRGYFDYHYGEKEIRFFGCAEYGEASLRPHLHILLFNCNIRDLQDRHPVPVDGKIKWIHQYDSNDNMLLFSPSIHKLWSKGSVQIGAVTFESCAYVSRYIVKKQLGDDAKQYKDAGVLPPYVRMSRCPGIGYSWYMDNLQKIYDVDKVVVRRGSKVVFCNPGKYCDNILKQQDEQAFYELKEKRHHDFYDGVDCKTYEGVDVITNLHNAEARKLSSAKLLKRTL